MDRTMWETVIVAGQSTQVEGRLLDVDLHAAYVASLRSSRDFIFNAAGIPQDLFRSN